MSSSSSRSAATHPLEAPGSPPEGGVSGTTTGPFTWALPTWMWAALGVLIPDAVSPKHTWVSSWMSTVVDPTPSESPAPPLPSADLVRSEQHGEQGPLAAGSARRPHGHGHQHRGHQARDQSYDEAPSHDALLSPDSAVRGYGRTPKNLKGLGDHRGRGDTPLIVVASRIRI